MSDKPKLEKSRKRGRVKGCEKTGGRQKGTPNKNTSLIKQAFDEADFNVIGEYVRIFKELDQERQLSEVKFCMRFLYQQLPNEKSFTVAGAERPEPLSLGEAKSSDLAAFIHQGGKVEEDSKQRSN